VRRHGTGEQVPTDRDVDHTLLIVSHDRAFLDNVVISTLVFEGLGQWREYVGGYADWLRLKKSAEPPSVVRPTQPKPERTSVRPRRASFKEKRELHDLPRAIEQLGAESGTSSR
jgi:ABC transport system ATP-binding/permease protein